jgi:hypothetical protein
MRQWCYNLQNTFLSSLGIFTEILLHKIIQKLNCMGWVCFVLFIFFLTLGCYNNEWTLLVYSIHIQSIVTVCQRMRWFSSNWFWCWRSSQLFYCGEISYSWCYCCRTRFEHWRTWSIYWGWVKLIMIQISTLLKGLRQMVLTAYLF